VLLVDAILAAWASVSRSDGISLQAVAFFDPWQQIVTKDNQAGGRDQQAAGNQKKAIKLE
jgi:hypothetical protein